MEGFSSSQTPFGVFGTSGGVLVNSGEALPNNSSSPELKFTCVLFDWLTRALLGRSEEGGFVVEMRNGGLLIV